MNTRMCVTGFLVLLLVASAGAQEASPAVKIYLPREKTVAGPKITLDDIAMVTGDDERVEKARALKLGRSPFPGETIVLNRQTIRARLASENLFPEDVVMTGAAQVAIHRNVSLIQPLEMINLAETFLQNHVPKDGLTWKLARKPKELTLPKEKSAVLKCRLDDKAPSGHVRVIIDAVAGREVLETRYVLFQMKYRSQRVVAARDISPGETITPENAKIELIEEDRKPGRWRSPFGAKAHKGIQAGAVIGEFLIRRPKPKVLVRRNQAVRIRIQGTGWTISALGTALRNGAADDIIPVRNVDSKKVIQARVDEVGNVVPLLPGQ